MAAAAATAVHGMEHTLNRGTSWRNAAGCAWITNENWERQCCCLKGFLVAACSYSASIAPPFFDRVQRPTLWAPSWFDPSKICRAHVVLCRVIEQFCRVKSFPNVTPIEDAFLRMYAEWRWRRKVVVLAPPHYLASHHGLRPNIRSVATSCDIYL